MKGNKKNIKIISVSILKSQIPKLDNLVQTGKYANRSHVVRVAVQELIEKNKDKLK